MRAANEEQEHRAAAAAAAIGLSGHASQNLFGTLVTCDCGHLASCRRTAPVVCSRNETQALKHRFTLVKWCCIAFLLLIFALIVFSGLLSSASTELTSGSSYLFLAIIFTSVVLFAGLCCLRARTICRHRAARHGSLQCRRAHNQPHSFRLPASFFAHSVHSRPHTHPSPTSVRFSESPFYNALLEACAGAPLPSYNEAIKEPVFAPPAYSTIIAQPALAASPVNGCTLLSNANTSPAENERTPESGSGSEQELLVRSQAHTAETVTSVEVHQSDDQAEVEVAATATEDKSSDE